MLSSKLGKRSARTLKPAPLAASPARRSAVSSSPRVRRCVHARGDHPLQPERCSRRRGRALFDRAPRRGARAERSRRGSPAVPKVTPDFHGPPPTNDWWSSLIWAFDGNPYSRPMFPHPLAVQAAADGLGVGYPTEAKIAARAYRFPYAEDLRHLDDRAPRPGRARAIVVGLGGDRGLGRRRRAGSTRRSATGSPSSTRGWAARTARTARTRNRRADQLGPGAQTWSSHGEVLGVTVHGHDYGLFAPTGATWRSGRQRGRLRSRRAKGSSPSRSSPITPPRRSSSFGATPTPSSPARASPGATSRAKRSSSPTSR